nr:MAG TPA: hypothetical protein [Caudoviricetes sp.]
MVTYSYCFQPSREGVAGLVMNERSKRDKPERARRATK